MAKPEDLKVYEKENANTTDVEEAIKQVKENDEKLKELNLNNIKVCILSLMALDFSEFVKKIYKYSQSVKYRYFMPFSQFAGIIIYW